MNTVRLTFVLLLTALAACGKQESTPAPANEPAPAATTPAQSAAPSETPAAPQSDVPPPSGAPAAPAEDISETDDPADGAQASNVQPSLKLGSAPSAGPATSAQFREGVHYARIVPAQPTTAAPGNVEVVEVFWYGCGHCFSLDPAIESWDDKNPQYVQFVRVPAMWNEGTRMHARLFYTAELLGKLDAVHSLIFREVHVSGNQLNTVEKIAAFFKQHGVSNEEFNKAFSSFAVENKLQRADFLNRRYRTESVPMFIVNGKYKTDVDDAGGERQLFTLIDELAAHEHGG